VLIVVNEGFAMLMRYVEIHVLSSIYIYCVKTLLIIMWLFIYDLTV